jgi:hypothetical protein
MKATKAERSRKLGNIVAQLTGSTNFTRLHREANCDVGTFPLHQSTRVSSGILGSTALVSMISSRIASRRFLALRG